MIDVIDHLYRKAIGQEYGPRKLYWDQKHDEFKRLGPVSFMALYGSEAKVESLAAILGRFAQEIAALQKERP